MIIRITIPIVPRAQKRDRIAVVGGHARSYTSAAQRLESDKLITLLMAHKPHVPLVGALNLWVRVFVPVPKSKPRKWRENALREELPIRPITRPDIDNYAKQILDVMTGTYFEDDRQVVDLNISKFYGDPSRWEIEIKEIP